MFFEMKQDAIKQGWLMKKSSGAGTLGRSVSEAQCFCVAYCFFVVVVVLLLLFTRGI